MKSVHRERVRTASRINSREGECDEDIEDLCLRDLEEVTCSNVILTPYSTQWNKKIRNIISRRIFMEYALLRQKIQ